MIRFSSSMNEATPLWIRKVDELVEFNRNHCCSIWAVCLQPYFIWFHLAQVLTNLLVRPKLFVILCHLVDLNSLLNTEPKFYTEAPKNQVIKRALRVKFKSFFLNRQSFTRITFLIDCGFAHASVQIMLFSNECNFTILLFILCMIQDSLQATADILFSSVG